jgi:transposase
MFGFNPYFALAGVIALAAAAGGGFVKGEQHADAKHDQQQLHQLVQALDERDAKQKQIDALETAATEREQHRQVEVREINREIPEIITRNHVVYDRTCVDDAGVRLLDRAQAAAATGRGEHSGAPAGEAEQPAKGPAHH